MGTRFVASCEMRVADTWKQRIVAAKSADSAKAEVMDALLPPFNRPYYPATARILRTPFLEEWTDPADELAARAGEFAPAMLDSVLRGEGHEYLPFTGQSAGRVRDIVPAAEIIRRRMAEAEAIIAGLNKFICDVGRLRVS
jgi:enoyl-[acyl-carrier protein] reductase II